MSAAQALHEFGDRAAARGLVCTALGVVLAPIGIGIPLAAFGVGACAASLAAHALAEAFAALARWLGAGDLHHGV